MKKGTSGVSPLLLFILLIALVIGALTIGLILNIRASRRATTHPAMGDKDAIHLIGTVSSPANAQAAVGSDWVGFHNGGALDGVAPAIGAPPMKLRWTLRMDDLEAAEVPATAPATSPSTAPTTSPTTAPAQTVYHSPGHFEAGPAIVAGVVYIADTAGAVRAINIASGKVVWTFHGEDGFETTPLVLNGRVFVGDLGGLFYAISAETGKLIWKFDDGGATIHASANYLAPNKDRILFATDGADIFCLDAVTGKQIWNGKSGDRVNGVPAVSNGSVLVSGCDSQLRALSGVDGKEESTADLGAVCPGSTAVSGDNQVLGTDQGRVLCISAKTHQQVWLFNDVQGNAMVYSSPAIANGIVVFGARDSRVYGLDLATGKQLWSTATRGDVDSSPAIAGGRVYIGSKDKKLHVLDLKTGNELWSFTAGRGIAASPAIGAGVLVIADEGGHLFCLE